MAYYKGNRIIGAYYNGKCVPLLHRSVCCTNEHELVEHEAREPTCIESGWDAYVTCNKCGYSTFKRVPALGHNYTDGVCTICGKEDGDGIEDINPVTFDHTDLSNVLESGLTLSKNNVTIAFLCGESTRPTPQNNTNQSIVRYFKGQMLRFVTSGRAIEEVKVTCKGDLTEGDISLTCNDDGQLTTHFDGVCTHITWVPNIDVYSVELTVAINYLDVVSVTITKVITTDEEPTPYNMVR